MKDAIPFTHAGKARRLVRQPRDRKLPEVERAGRPWVLRYTRPDTRKAAWKSIGGAHETPKVLAAKAKAFLKGLETQPAAAWIAANAARRGLLVATLVHDFIDAGCPESTGRPRTHKRLDDMIAQLNTALWYFGDLIAERLRPGDCIEFAEWKRTQLKAAGRAVGQGGARSCELALSALSGALWWGVLTRRLEVNPLANRPALRAASEITHHHRFVPDSDEELHALASWCFKESPATVVAGAQILFCAMTGLRSGELPCLQWPAEGRPYNGPGMLQVCKPDGSEITWLHVRREKRGTNPVVRVHPALAMLIEAWRAYLARTAPGVEWMFPGPGGGQGRADFSRVLARAAEGIGSPANRFGETRRTSHALRAYYVEVRRNAGASDLAIAGDLGQGGGDRLIRTTYGAADSFASGRLCWLPTGIPPAWQLLS